MTFSRTRSANRFSISALAVAGALAVAPVFAHAALRHATPAAGEIVETAPKITLEFSADVDLTAVELSLRGANGEDVELEPAGDDATTGTKVARKPKAPLPPGTYQVKWRVLSVDGHHTRGSYAFEVKSAMTPASAAGQ